ncbi:putative uncharacterized protein [Pseudomonas sp. StFLB209]|uniref:hypothetical protein n=1 Tax=Pseudomonas sp. StFLB209 TaxID=1028989 RepID=UPI0004F716C2|nr:hypothetical protein [Pseudomonas sp. StFLB209]BAP43909.1 putative uncharacterized protein [Pseudomonas sp. StFLB209]
MCNYLTDHRVRMLLAGIAIALSSVTALSVGMAMTSLIQDPLLGFVFASAAVLLDLFKYLAWPIALGLLANQKRVYAGLMIVAALILGSVSAWATYDRLLSSIMSGQAKHAVAQQRIADLQDLRSAALRQLATFEDEARSIGLQAQQLRERGIITKAQDLEASASARIDAQRAQVHQRLEVITHDIGQLQTQTLSIVQLPVLVVVLLCSGFAIALEAVPALIGSALRVGVIGTITEPVVAATVEEPSTTLAVAPATPATTSVISQQQDLFGAADGDLMQRLLENLKVTASGSPVRVREFAATLRIGNKRLMKLFQSAIDLGALRKTKAGYVVA